MLYVIGGVPRAGKTYLARALHRQLGLSVFTTDAIVAMFTAVAPDLQIDYGHPDRRGKIAPGLKAAVRQLTNNYGSYVIEGELLDPWLAEELGSVTEVTACFLGMSKPDVSTIIEHEGGNAWVANLTEAKQEALPSVLRMLDGRLREECRRFGAAYFDTSAAEYHTVIDSAFRHLTGPVLSSSTTQEVA